MSYLDDLKLVTAWESEPALSADELEGLLESSAVADADGLEPSKEEWTPTYNLNAAAAQGWLIKAARAAATVEVDPPSGVVTSKVFDNCRAMARIYKAKSNFAIGMK